MDTRDLSTFANVGSYKANEDWWFYLPAILFVNTIVISIVRFMSNKVGKPINQWYDEFGLSAVLTDISSLAITIAITRYIYTCFFMEQEGWSIWYFIGLAVIIQVVYDFIFDFGIVPKIPKRDNSMIDVLKAYTEAGPVIILSDAIKVGSSIGFASMLKNQDFHYTTSTTIVTAYILFFLLYVNTPSNYMTKDS
jgi:hypothetical protein